jgi:protein gp37
MQAEKRIPTFLQIPAAKRFVSVEPMLGPVDLRGRLCHWTNPDGSGSWFSPVPGKVQKRLIDLVICGCESGPGRRPFDQEWARYLKDQCVAAGVPFFFKQSPGETHGSVIKLPMLDGHQCCKAHKREFDGFETKRAMLRTMAENGRWRPW